MQLNAFLVRPFVEQGLREELGPGDTTGGFLAGNDLITEALIYAKQHGVVCGLLLAEETVRLLEPEAKVVYEAQDGDEIEPGDVLLRITAKAQHCFRWSGQRSIGYSISLVSRPRRDGMQS